MEAAKTAQQEAQIGLRIEEESFNYTFISSPLLTNVDKNEVGRKVYVSVEILSSHSNTEEVNPTFVTQVNCLDITYSATHSWQMLKTFKRFVELHNLLQKEFPEDMINISQPHIQPSEPAPNKRKILSNILNSSKRRASVVSRPLRVQLSQILQKWIDDVLLKEFVMFSPTLMRFLAIREQLGTVRLFSGNQLRDEIQANTELQLRRAIHHHETQLEHAKATVELFVSSSAYANDEITIQKLRVLRAAVEEISILLEACRLNLKIWIEQHSTSPSLAHKDPNYQSTDSQKANLLLQLNETATPMNSTTRSWLQECFSARKLINKDRNSAMNDTQILNQTIRLANSVVFNPDQLTIEELAAMDISQPVQETSSTDKAKKPELMKSTSIYRSFQSLTELPLEAPPSAEEEFHKWNEQMDELVSWLETSMDKNNISHAIRFRTALRKKMREIRSLYPNDEKYKLMLLRGKKVNKKCETDFGEHIPTNPDSDSDDSLFGGSSEEDDGDEEHFW